MQSYTIREEGKLTYGVGKEQQIPEHVAGRLAVLAQRSRFAGEGGSGVLEHGRYALRAQGVVGILATKDCSLEILPKIDVAPDTPDKQNATIRKRLIHMLAVVLKLKVEPGSITDLAWQRETLLEILIGIFCDKLTEAVRKGMPRRYVEQEDDLSALRGRLNVVRQFTRHAVNPSRLACRFDDLSKDIALNRIMKAALLHLFWMSRKPENQQRLRELAFVDYADVADISPPSALRWDEVVIDRTNRRWQELLSMARLFLQDRYQTTTGGEGQGITLLFEMHKLFEEYVGRLISRALAGTNLEVVLQGRRHFCLSDLSEKTAGRGLFQTQPDILIRRRACRTVTHVIDTKWKRISPLKNDPKRGVLQRDVYQMMAYAQLYGAPRLTLLYPHHSELGDKEGVHCRYQINRHETVPETKPILEIATIDVADGENMLDRLRRRIIANEAVVEPVM